MWAARATKPRQSLLATLLVASLCAVVILSGCAIGGSPTAKPAGNAASLGISDAGAVKVFDPGVGAPLPNDRIVAAYGIVNGGQYNGPASTIQMLDAFLPQLQQLGQQYAALDPTHPVQLALDLVVNVIQPCSQYPKWCASFTDDATIQAYVDYCQQHHLLLFFDLQLGVEPVADAVVNQLQTYLQKYPFTELALDTEFHFPNTPHGYAEAAGYPCCLGWMDASEVNWAIAYLAQASLQNHLPRKVLVVHQWDPAVIHNKGQIKLDQNVSVVLQSDGWGGAGNKIGDYQVFVQQSLVEYGGYKLFFPYPGDTQFDAPFQSPQDVMQLFPQPLFVSYQ
jgi:hypothetical protein